VGGIRIRLEFKGAVPHRSRLFPAMSTAVTSRDLPEWAVSIVPLELGAARTPAGENTHQADGFMAHMASDGSRVATFRVDSGRRKKDIDAALASGVHLILRREGRLDLHAAAVAPGPEEGGLLIVGPKGVGKSSLTIALALSGWAFFSDDHVITWLDHDLVRVAGLRVPLFLTPDAVARLPPHFPKGQDVPSMGKQMFQPEDLFAGQHRDSGGIAAIVFPERTEHASSTLESLRPVDCFQRLLSLSPFLAADASARPCIEVARAIADLPAFILRAGPDLLDPATAARTLQRALA
jgi:hypothetical protein